MEEEIILETGDKSSPTVVKHIHHYETKEKEEIMSPMETVNLFGAGGMGSGGALAGAGGGAFAGAALGSLLLGRNGVLGAGVDGGVVGARHVTPEQLTAGLASVIDNTQNTAVLQQLGQISAAIPLAEANTQLALSITQSELAGQINTAQVANLAGQATINKNVSDAIAASLASQNNINLNVLTQGSSTRETVTSFGVANLNATNEAKYAVTSAIRDDGDKTRALISRQYEDTLNRELTEARNALIELRAAGRVRESEINIVNTNTAVAAQSQAQVQGQQQLQFLAQLGAEVRNLANDVQVVRQTQSNVNFGTQTGTAQTASAANNRVN